MLRLAVMLLAGSIASIVVAAGRPKVSPDKWAIDYDKEYCVLSRDGQPGENGIAFRTRPMADEHDLLFYNLPSGLKRRSFKGQLHRVNGSVGAARWALVERSSGRKQTILETSITSQELAEAFETASLHFSGEGMVDIHAALPNVSKARAALRECEDDLAKRWGVDPLETRLWATPAKSKSDLRELFWDQNPSKYGVLRAHHVRAMLVIDESGKAVTCTIIEKSRVAWVNEQICETLLREGQFVPARDASGTAMRGKVVTPRITSVRLR